MRRKERRRQFENGQGLVEYAMALILVGIIVILILVVFGEEVSQIYCEVIEAVDDDAVPASCTAEDEDPPEDDEGSISVSCGPLLFQGSGISQEATVTDNAGESDITAVVFTINGHSITENHYHYCLGGTDNPCSGGPYRSLSTFGLDHGDSATVNVVATDAEGHTGSCSRSFTVP